MRRVRVRLHALALAGVLGCTPVLDWREVPVADTGLQALFPCKPQRMSREAPQGGILPRIDLLACRAGAMTFAIGHADLGAAADTGVALVAMRSALVANAGASPSPGRPLLTQPADAPLRVAVSGRAADGSPLEIRAQFFARGSRVFQASVMGSGVPDEAAQSFFDGLRWPGAKP